MMRRRRAGRKPTCAGWSDRAEKSDRMGDMKAQTPLAGQWWRGRRAVAGGVLVAQAWVLFAPASPNTGIPPAWHLDKLVHAFVFAAATCTVIRAGGRPTVTVAGMVGYAAASEVVQHYLLSARSGDRGDLVADLVGVALGAWVAHRHP